jgi:hypothetical protein
VARRVVEGVDQRPAHEGRVARADRVARFGRRADDPQVAGLGAVPAGVVDRALAPASGGSSTLAAAVVTSVSSRKVEQASSAWTWIR